MNKEHFKAAEKLAAKISNELQHIRTKAQPPTDRDWEILNEAASSMLYHFMMFDQELDDTIGVLV